MNGQIQYGNGRAMTSGGTGAPGPETAAALRAFRQELRSLGENPGRAELESLLGRACELGLTETEIRPELLEIRASMEEIAFAERLARDGLPVLPPVTSLADGESCHFATPVRFGRRRGDQIGHVEMTSSWLRFHGALDLSVAWAGVTAAHRDRRDIVLALADSRRELRFCCHSYDEALRGATVARRLLAGGSAAL